MCMLAGMSKACSCNRLSTRYEVETRRKRIYEIIGVATRR